MEITINEFREQYLPKLQEEFHQKTQDSIIANVEMIKKKTHEQMDTFIKLLTVFQKKLPLEIGMIQVSLLNTSLYLGKPQIAYTAYDEEGLMGRELLTMKRDADWLFTAWDEYKDVLAAEVGKLHCEQFIRAEGIRQLAWESFPFLQTCMYATTKYVFRDMEQFSQFDDLLTADQFYVRVGAYMDWGQIVYLKEPETDIFFDRFRKKFRFCQFRQFVYNQKDFSKMDLSSARFKECEFVHCKFDEVDLNDAQFIDCRFYHCSFHNVKLYGATFERTTIKKSPFQDCSYVIDPNTSKPEDFTDIYKPLEMVDCTVDEESKIGEN